MTNLDYNITVGHKPHMTLKAHFVTYDSHGDARRVMPNV